MLSFMADDLSRLLGEQIDAAREKLAGANLQDDATSNHRIDETHRLEGSS